MSDTSFVRPLAEAIVTEVAAIGEKADCGVNNNWLPVVARALLCGNDDPTMQLIYTMSGPPLPESMQKTPPPSLLRDDGTGTLPPHPAAQAALAMTPCLWQRAMNSTPQSCPQRKKIASVIAHWLFKSS